jgi:hypothetical protein
VDLERAVPAMDWMSNTSRTAVSFSNSYGWSRNRFPGRENEKVKTFVYQAAAEHDRYLAPRIFGFAQAIYTHNLAQNLELQQSYMGGLGVAIIKRPHHNFQWKGSLGYIQRGYYISALNVDVIGSTFGESYEYQYKRARLYEEISGTPAWNNSNRWAAASKASLRLPITESLGFEVSSMDSYLHGAPSGYKKNSFQLWFGISYSFE